MNKIALIGPGTVIEGMAYQIGICVTRHNKKPHPSWKDQHKHQPDPDVIVFRVSENVPNGTYPVGRFSTRPDGSSRRGKNLKPTGSRQERYTKSPKR